MTAAPQPLPARGLLEDLIPREGILAPDELEELARDIVDLPELWEHLVRVDPGRRRYELIDENESVDAWVLSWMPGQGTGFHDHYISSVGLCCALGGVREDLMVYGAEHDEVRLRPGDSRRGGAGYIHRVRHELGEPAVTIHVYSPRLDWVGQYRLGDGGVVRREVRPGRNELTEQLIAQRALQGVLERF
jgi:hypothetical protein